MCRRVLALVPPFFEAVEAVPPPFFALPTAALALPARSGVPLPPLVLAGFPIVCGARARVGVWSIGPLGWASCLQEWVVSNGHGSSCAVPDLLLL